MGDVSDEVDGMALHMLCARHSEEDAIQHIADGYLLTAFRSAEDARIEHVKAFAWFARWVKGGLNANGDVGR